MATPTYVLPFCDQCGSSHRADYSHQSSHGDHAVYAVVCPTSPDVVDYWTDEVVMLADATAQPR